MNKVHIHSYNASNTIFCQWIAHQINKINVYLQDLQQNHRHIISYYMPMNKIKWITQAQHMELSKWESISLLISGHMRVMAGDDLLYNLYVARLLGGAGNIQWAHYFESCLHIFPFLFDHSVPQSDQHRMHLWPCQAEPGLDIQWFGFRRLEPVLLI